MTASTIFGIDLGTTYSCIAHVDESGIPTVIENLDGQPTTPSVVMFDQSGTIAVGQEAKNQLGAFPDRVVRLVKRHMGDPDWIFSVDGQAYTAREISSKILGALVSDARSFTGEDVADVVITVPAYFGQVEREQTAASGKIAGLNVIDVINEPTAAAFAYGFGRATQEDETVLVYDLGGGTFDVTMIKIVGGDLAVVATDGDHELGGDNWDQVLADICVRKFMEAETDADDPAFDPVAMGELQNEVEKGKRSLSNRPSANVRVASGATMAMVEVTREEFEAQTEALLQQTLTLTDRMLEAARGKGVDKVDRLLLVGGSSIMPAVATALHGHLGLEPQLRDPHMAVAKGAALWGQGNEIKVRLVDKLKEMDLDVAPDELDKVDPEVLRKAAAEVSSDVSLTSETIMGLATTKASNVCSQGFGVVALDANREEYVDFLIHRNDTLPIDAGKTFGTSADDQTTIRVQVFEQGTADEQGNPSVNTMVGERLIDSLPTGHPEGTPVDIRFEMSNSGRLKITAGHPGRAEPFVFEEQTGQGTTEEEIEASKVRMSGLVRAS